MAEIQIAGESTLDGQTVALVGTPGFNHTSQTDADILGMVGVFLAPT